MKTKQKYLLPLVIITLGIIIIIYLGYDKIKEVIPSNETQPKDWEIAAGDAIKTNDFKECDQIKDDKYKTVCINNIALNKANETGDVSFCDKVDGKLITKAYCQENAASQSSQTKEDISQCDKIQDEQDRAFCKESFFISLAIKKDDITICNQATKQQTKDTCKDMFTVRKENQKDFKTFDCKKLSTPQTTTECEKLKKVLAQEKKDMEACKEFKSPVMLDLCFASMTMSQQQMPTQDLPNPLNQSKQ